MDEPTYGPGDRVSVRFEPESISVNATVVEQRGGMIEVELDDNSIKVTTGVAHVSPIHVGRV